MSAEATMVRCCGVARTFGAGSAATVALEPTDCEVGARERIALVGPSGSGKSTLLHILAGLDDPTAGQISWPGIGDRQSLAPGRVAVIFQGPSLLPALTVAENVALPLVLDGAGDTQARVEARSALELVSLIDIADKLPEEISGGQAQRAAIARALAGKPVLILADEPTGQLDRATGWSVVDVLLSAAQLCGAALVVSTHDPTVAVRLTRRWQMHSGSLVTDSVPGITDALESQWSR